MHPSSSPKSCSSAQSLKLLLRAMESRGHCLGWTNSVLCIAILATILFTHCDARIMGRIWKPKGSKLQKSPITEFINKLKLTNHVTTNVDPYTLNSPFYLPPFESLSPLPQPDRSPPIYQYPPFTPQSPSQPPPSPPSYGLPTPPPAGGYIHGPPANPPEHGFTPPSFFPSPPHYQPSPPKLVPSPPKHVPGQPIYGPPLLSPPSPLGQPPPPHKGSQTGVWCVAKPTVPDSIIQAAMDYACGCGADCKSIQPNGICFQPNTLIAHASYAFNSYWQNTKGTGGTCDFGGTAMLVTVDPSFAKCHFNYS